MSTALPPFPATVKKVFVAYLDTHVGQNLTQRLLSQDYEVSGLLLDSTNASSVSSKVKKVLKRSDTDAIRKAVLESDLIVYQLVGTVEDAINALRLLTVNHYEQEKRFVLISTALTWFETPPLQEAAPPAADEEEQDPEPVTEDQYNRRVPHIKYLAWREVEKLCCTSHCERLKTFVVFSGLVYGLGEDTLHPLFKQAWSLAPEGLPVFGSGRQIIPMIHVNDLSSLVSKLLSIPEIPEMRYIFGVDEGNCNWSSIVNALNTALGNGRTFRVPTHEFGLHDNVEYFTQNLKVESVQMNNLLSEDSDWTAKTGFVENIDLIVTQYRNERHIQPLRIVVLGPPAVGKSYISREIAAAMSVPHFTIGDIVAEYRYQEIELKEEVTRVKEAKIQAKIQQVVDDKREQILAERKAQMEADLAARASAEPLPEDDNDDIPEEEEIEVHLTSEEEKEIRDEIMADDSDETLVTINEKLEEIKRVLNLKLKPIGVEVQEPPNPKDKKKAPPKKSKEPVEVPKEIDPKDIRLSDRALAFMVKWKLTRTQCRNQGYILDGFPKTIRQARLVFEDTPIEIPEDPEEPDLPLDKEEKPCAENIFPELVLHLKAGDTFLLERLQKIQHEHPHNAPEDFQRRLELYKTNFDAPLGVIQYLESARSVSGKSATVKAFDMESCPLVPPPPAKSRFMPKVIDAVTQKVVDSIGKPRNFGPTPQDAQREAERIFNLEAEQRAEKEAIEAERKQREAADVASAKIAKNEESTRVAAMKETERQMLEQRKGPLKAYLMANVVPVLTKGLIEVCNERPDDPVDYLAEWLFKHNPEDHPDLYS